MYVKSKQNKAELKWALKVLDSWQANSRERVGEACKTKRPTSCVLICQPDKKKHSAVFGRTKRRAQEKRPDHGSVQGLQDQGSKVLEKN